MLTTNSTDQTASFSRNSKDEANTMQSWCRTRYIKDLRKAAKLSIWNTQSGSTHKNGGKPISKICAEGRDTTVAINLIHVLLIEITPVMPSWRLVSIQLMLVLNGRICNPLLLFTVCLCAQLDSGTVSITHPNEYYKLSRFRVDELAEALPSAKEP